MVLIGREYLKRIRKRWIVSSTFGIWYRYSVSFKSLLWVAVQENSKLYGETPCLKQCEAKHAAQVVQKYLEQHATFRQLGVCGTVAFVGGVFGQNLRPAGSAETDA